MSDLSMYKDLVTKKIIGGGHDLDGLYYLDYGLTLGVLEDIAWEELGDDNDDHIVPHTGSKKKGYSIESECNKKPRHERSCAESSVDYKNATIYDIQRKEGTNFTAVREEKETMLEKGPWSHSSNGAFSASLDGDPNIRTSCSTSDDDRTSNQCISSNMDSICSDSRADDSILGDQATAVDNNLFYQLNNANPTENDLGLLDNNLQDKESNDLLYYGWPEIENFDEVDRMFRSCDSTFGLEIDNDNELGWLSSSHEIEGSDDALKSSFNFSGCDQSALNSASQNQNVCGNGTGMLNSESDQKLTPVDLKRVSQELTTNSSSIVINGPGTDNHVDDDSQIHSCVSQLKEQKPSKEKRKERSLDNGDSFIYLENLKQVEESSKSLNFLNSFSVESHEQQKTTHQTSLRTPIPLMKGHPSNQVLTSPTSTIINSNSGLPSVSLRDSSYGSKPNEMQSVESARDISFQRPVVSTNKKKDRIHQRRSSGHIEKSKLMEKSDSEPASSQKQISNFESDVEGLSEVNGSNLGIQGEVDISNIQESPCMSSGMDEVSIEASSFRQLQQIMEQLDVRTKLCIRDSLYRLARSAEQRHKCFSQTSGGRDNKDASGALISDETNKCTGFMDMETETNPIDRSIAHLLFHRPSDPSATAALDAVPTKSYAMVQAPHIGPVMAEKPICQEETTPAINEATEE